MDLYQQEIASAKSKITLRFYLKQNQAILYSRHEISLHKIFHNGIISSN